MSDDTVELLTTPSMLVASYKMTIPTNDSVPVYFERAHHALHDFISTNGVKVLSPFFSIWHQSPDVVENEVVEAVFEIDKLISSADAVQVYKVPETLVASLVHKGEFEELILAHKTLGAWISANGYTFNGGYREIYHKNDPKDMSKSETEIQYHVVRQLT